MEFIRRAEIDGVVFSTHKPDLDIAYVHAYLQTSYWAAGIPGSTVETAIENSICIGIYINQKQIGFARLITDQATFGWLADVFVDETYRGRGVSKNMMKFIMSFEFMPGLRRVMLATRDAHGLYAQSGFAAVANPDKLMEIVRQDIYTRKS